MGKERRKEAARGLRGRGGGPRGTSAVQGIARGWNSKRGTRWEEMGVLQILGSVFKRHYVERGLGVHISNQNKEDK